jgi:hypothetical protein
VAPRLISHNFNPLEYRSREEDMLEYFAYALLGLGLIGGLLYVTMSPEAEEPPNAKRPEPKQ